MADRAATNRPKINLKTLNQNNIILACRLSASKQPLITNMDKPATFELKQQMDCFNISVESCFTIYRRDIRHLYDFERQAICIATTTKPNELHINRDMRQNSTWNYKGCCKCVAPDTRCNSLPLVPIPGNKYWFLVHIHIRKLWLVGDTF